MEAMETVRFVISSTRIVRSFVFALLIRLLHRWMTVAACSPLAGDHHLMAVGPTGGGGICFNDNASN
jgi:hypothetical protein